AGAVRPCRPPAAVRRSRPRIAPASRARRPGRDRGRTGAEGPDSPDPGRPPRSWPGRIRTLARPSEAPLSQEILVEQDVTGQWYWVYRFLASDGKWVAMARSATYWNNKQDCTNNAEYVKKYISDAPIN